MIKKLLFWIKIIAVNLIVIFLLVEIIFRIFPKLMPDFPQWNYSSHYYFYKKNVLDRTDSIGKKKPALVFLGDSYIRGAEVMRGKEWVALLEKRNPDFEFINMGFGGSGTLEERILFSHHILSSSAQVSGVVLGVYRNDFMENVEHQKIFDKSQEAPFINRLNKEVSDPRRFGELRKFLDTYFCTYRLFKWVLKGTSNYGRLPKTDDYILIEKANVYFGKKDGLYARDYLDNYLSVTSKHLSELKDLLRSQKIPLIVFYFPSKIVTYRQEIEALRPEESYAFVETERDFLQKWCEINGVPYFDFTDLYRRHKYEDVYLEIDTHWTEKGHMVLADELQKLGVLDMFRKAKAQ